MVADIKVSSTEQLPSFELLAFIGQWFDNFATTPLGFLPFSSFLPLTGFTIIHSLRVAYLYHSVLQSQGVRVGQSTNDVSFIQASLVCTTLVLSGTTMAALLKAEPSGLLSEGSGEMVAAYMVAGSIMKWLHPMLSQLPQTPLKLFCFLIDGFATTFGTLSLGLIPTLQDSRMMSSQGQPLVLPSLILPILCGSGASLLVPVFGLFQPRFTFAHPGFLSQRLSVDFWGPWLITLVYGTIVDGRGLLFGTTRQFVSHGILRSTSHIGSQNIPLEGAWMRSKEAHVLCSLILSSAYVLNEFGPTILSSITKRSTTGLDLKTKETEIGEESEKNNYGTSSAIETASGQVSKRKT